MPSRILLSMSLTCILGLTACSGVESEAKFPTGADRNLEENIYEEPDSIFGRDGLQLFSNKKEQDEETGIGVNSYLWRASLDTISFMPLASADPFGGVIITDWYSAPNNPGERFKLNVLILGRDLRSDGVRVQAFRQVRKGDNWSDAAVPETMAKELEDAILTRARQIRIAASR